MVMSEVTGRKTEGKFGYKDGEEFWPGEGCEKPQRRIFYRRAILLNWAADDLCVIG